MYLYPLWLKNEFFFVLYCYLIRYILGFKPKCMMQKAISKWRCIILFLFFFTVSWISVNLVILLIIKKFVVYLFHLIIRPTIDIRFVIIYAKNFEFPFTQCNNCVFCVSIEIWWNQGLHCDKLGLSKIWMGLKIFLNEPMVYWMVNYFMSIITNQNCICTEHSNIINLHLINIKPIEVIFTTCKIYKYFYSIFLLIQILSNNEKCLIVKCKITSFLNFYHEIRWTLKIKLIDKNTCFSTISKEYIISPVSKSNMYSLLSIGIF